MGAANGIRSVLSRHGELEKAFSARGGAGRRRRSMNNKNWKSGFTCRQVGTVSDGKTCGRRRTAARVRRIRVAHVATGQRCQKFNNNNNNNNNDDGNYILTGFFETDPTAACDRKRTPSESKKGESFWDDDSEADYNKLRRWLTCGATMRELVRTAECNYFKVRRFVVIAEQAWMIVGLDNRWADTGRRACSCDGREKQKKLMCRWEDSDGVTSCWGWIGGFPVKKPTQKEK